MRFSSVRAVVDAVTSWEFWCWVVMVPFFAWIVWTGFSDPQFFANHRFFDRSVPSAGSSESTVEPTLSPSVSPSAADEEQRKILLQIQAVQTAVSKLPSTPVAERDDLFEGLVTDEFLDAYLTAYLKFEMRNEARFGERFVLYGSETMTLSRAEADVFVCMDTSRLYTRNIVTGRVVSSSPPRGSYYVKLIKNSHTTRWEVDYYYPVLKREAYCDSFSAK